MFFKKKTLCTDLCVLRTATFGFFSSNLILSNNQIHSCNPKLLYYPTIQSSVHLIQLNRNNPITIFKQELTKMHNLLILYSGVFNKLEYSCLLQIPSFKTSHITLWVLRGNWLSPISPSLPCVSFAHLKPWRRTFMSLFLFIFYIPRYAVIHVAMTLRANRTI